MVAAIFDNQYGTSNYFTKQFMMATRAYINDLQIVYVKTDSTVTSTTSFSDLDSQTYTLSDPTEQKIKVLLIILKGAYGWYLRVASCAVASRLPVAPV